jgi:ABC-type uncharacterized transport system involved in gliding motility auxiliary subunit
MDITRNTTRRLALQRILFTLLFLTVIGLLGYLSTRYVYLADWTINNQNSLNEVSTEVVKSLAGPVKIVSYTNNVRIKDSVDELVTRYRRHKPDISLSFINPDDDPETIRALNISVDGEIIVHYQERQESLTELSEQKLTNALHRLLRARERKIVFIEGHGERSPERQANFDLSSFSAHLKKQGFVIETLNLARAMVIPDQIAILVIAGPQANFLPGEVRMLVDYVKSGGNLLWLGDPLNLEQEHPMHGLLPLSELLGIEFLDGVVVDSTAQQYGIARPDYAIVTDYPQHPINNGFDSVTLFPQAAGIERLPTFMEENEANSNEPTQEPRSLNRHFEMQPFLSTVERSWVETSPIQERVHFSELLDIIGPINIGMVLTRQMNQDAKESKAVSPGSTPESPSKEQRIIIMGDGDFLSNTFLGNAGNLDLGINIFNWLSHDEQFIAIPARIKDDIILDLTPGQLSLLGSIFLFAIPGLLIFSGSLIWFRRRNR